MARPSVLEESVLDLLLQELEQQVALLEAGEGERQEVGIQCDRLARRIRFSRSIPEYSRPSLSYAFAKAVIFTEGVTYEKSGGELGFVSDDIHHRAVMLGLIEPRCDG